MQGESDEHRPYEDYAVRHVMGSLDESESGAFRSHLLDCSECRARVGELRSIASDLAEVERSERRERAAQQVETKERERDVDDDIEEFDEPPRRSLKIVAIVGLLLIIVLSVWNFVLRAQTVGLESTATNLLESAQTINFGDAWVTEALAPGHEGIVRVEDGKLAVMVRGTDDDATYAVVFYDAAGGLLDLNKLPSIDGIVRGFVENLPADYARVDITLSRGANETVIFRAVDS